MSRKVFLADNDGKISEELEFENEDQVAQFVMKKLKEMNEKYPNYSQKFNKKHMRARHKMLPKVVKLASEADVKNSRIDYVKLLTKDKFEKVWDEYWFCPSPDDISVSDKYAIYIGEFNSPEEIFKWVLDGKHPKEN
jgi:hypothetical protein